MAAQFTREDRLARLRERLTAPAPAPVVDPVTDPDGQQVVDWLALLGRLNGVPFHYLVPDAGMLPPESLRFFQVDPGWIEALLDGAFSLGHAPGGGAAAAVPVPRPALTTGPSPVSGFLLRSAVVSGWPGLEAYAFADPAGETALAPVRLERLAPSVLLGLYAGTLARVDLREPGEALHFGVDAAGAGQWRKTLRYADSAGPHTIGDPIPGSGVDVPLRAGAGRSVLRAADLAAAMRSSVWADAEPTPDLFTPGQFGLEMVEGVQAVSFRTS